MNLELNYLNVGWGVVGFLFWGIGGAIIGFILGDVVSIEMKERIG